jgi:alginate O-acetyltransferase complex protein AlgJ
MALLWLPTVDSLFHVDPTRPHNENRAMAVFPEAPASWHGLQDYLAGLEVYFNDHFGCRKCLVQWNNKLRWNLFREKKDATVLIGKNGWLYIMEGNLIDHYTGQLQFTPAQLHAWQTLLEKRRDWLAKRGIAYVFVIAPNKESVYPEELPDWVKKIRPQTKVDQFYDYMRQHSTVPVLDLRPAVRDAKSMYPTYLKTDTHWNSYGGFVAYQALARELKKQIPLSDAISLSSFTITNQAQPGGDLDRLLGVSTLETNAYHLIPNPALPLFTTSPVPLDDPQIPKFTDNLQAHGRLLVYQDSFALAWIPLLAYHFNHVDYFWQYNFDPAWIDREKPNVVVSEMLERMFNVQDPEKIMAQDALP